MKLSLTLCAGLFCTALLAGLALLSAPTPVSSAPAGQATCAAPGWSLVAAYPIQILENAVVAHGGYIYSFGGQSTSVPLTNVYRYDPTANTWTALAALPEERASSFAVTDGTYIYLVGGRNATAATNTLIRYDPATNSYTGLAPMLAQTWLHTSTYLDGKIYALAGCSTASCPSNGYTTFVESYDVATNQWSSRASYPEPVAYLMSDPLGSYMYGLGGVFNQVPQADTYRYDPVTNQWDDASIASFPEGRWSSATTVLNGRMFVAGGYILQGGQYYADGRAYRYEPSTSLWVPLPNMPVSRGLLHGASVGESFYTVGGQSDWGQPGTTDVQRYTEPACSLITPTTTPTSTPTDTPTPTATPASRLQLPFTAYNYGEIPSPTPPSVAPLPAKP